MKDAVHRVEGVVRCRLWNSGRRVTADAKAPSACSSYPSCEPGQILAIVVAVDSVDDNSTKSTAETIHKI